MKTKVAVLIATWFGCGYSPVAPGTAGALAALLIAWPLADLTGWHPLWLAVVSLAAMPVSVWASTITARKMARKDPGVVVVDEVLGQWMALSGAAVLSARAWVLAFLLFRLFDIWKPWPIRRLEALPEGWGIVADDIAAGIYAALALTLVLWAGECFNLY
ncbi:MAG: phosphatidylglycerophosphatase A [Bryobacteraceae bacterium]